MAMLQHYYTSCTRGTSGHSGFQIKAMSPGISPEDLKRINNMIAYRIPPGLNDNDVGSHPVAFRYNYFGSDKCILSCVQSNGKDENGRPGNFFAHTVLTAASDFELFPPIMYWRHAFWQTDHSSSALEIPTHPKFDAIPSLEFEQILPFLAESNRQAWFYKLLCAVIHYYESKRPIIILDQTDNVAMWIAAVTFALPNLFRSLITFATYHHDPYQSPFLITGTTRDSKFRFSSDEYISYFVLNAEAQRISEVTDSNYAKYIAENFQSQVYEEKLPTFFEYISNRFKRPDLKYMPFLDKITTRYLALREQTLSADSLEVQQSVRNFLEETIRKGSLSDEDLSDLATAANLLREAIFISLSAKHPIDKQLMDHFSNALKLLKEHDSTYLNEWCKEDVKLLETCIFQDKTDYADFLAAKFRDVYSERRLASVVNQESFITNLAKSVPTNNTHLHQLVWKIFGPLFFLNARPSNSLEELIHKTLTTISHTSVSDPYTPFPEAEAILEILVSAVPGENAQDKYEYILYSAAVWYQQKHSSPVFNWLYYVIVSKIDFVKRPDFRHKMSDNRQFSFTYQELAFIEAQTEIRNARHEDLVSVLEEWHKLTDDPELQTQIIDQSLEFIWNNVQRSQRDDVVEKLLISEPLSGHLPLNWEEKLVNVYLSGLSLRTLDAKTVKLYEKLLSYPQPNSSQSALIAGCIALSTGEFPESSVAQLADWFFGLDELNYREAFEKFLHRFFVEDFLLKYHVNMLQATYVQHREDIFWGLYWTHFKSLSSNRKQINKQIELLSFWFEKSSGLWGDKQFLVPAFFLNLPAVLDEMREEKSFNNFASLFSSQAKQYSWFYLISDYFVPDKGLAKLLKFGRR